MLTERVFSTDRGDIHYWTGVGRSDRPTLVFLPGLTADHRLFDRQTEAFAGEYGLLVWDAPGHAASRPFRLDFTLTDKAVWLHEILAREGVRRPVLIGQSMGGYVAQCFLERYPGEAAGFVSIDSAPLQRKYVTGAEIWLLKRMEPVYRLYPWESLKKAAARGCAETTCGRALMESFLADYTKEEYCRLAAHGYRLLAEAMEADLPYRIDCPAVLICGERDRAGSSRAYNRRWAKTEGLPLFRIPGAGHNSNTDRPDEVNAILRDFLEGLPTGGKEA